jgi:hypothetical protein
MQHALRSLTEGQGWKLKARNLLICLLSLLNKNNPRDANLYGAFCLAHAGFLRAGEFTWSENDLVHGHTKFAQRNLTRSSIQFEEDHLLLTLPNSKTDPFRKASQSHSLAQETTHARSRPCATYTTSAQAGPLWHRCLHDPWRTGTKHSPGSTWSNTDANFLPNWE